MRREMLVAALIAAGTGAAWAASGAGPGEGRRGGRPGGDGPGPGFDRMRQELGLSDQQVEEMRALRSQHRKAAIRQRADMQVARLELQELIHAANPDEKAIVAKVKVLSDLQATALRARVEGQLAVQKVLTPEQREKMRELRPGARGERGPGDRWRHRGFGRGPRPGPDAGEDEAAQ